MPANGEMKTRCGMFFWDAAKQRWVNRYGVEMAADREFFCAKCGTKLKKKGKLRRRIDDPNTADE